MYYTYEVINGVANKVVFGEGLMSNETSHKKLEKIILVTSARQGNVIDLYLEKEKVFSVKDDIANLPSDNPKQEFVIDIDIPVGQKIVPALTCGGTATDLTIVYEYTEVR
ncbi:MAG: hypothetical protein DRP58_08645 [Spirochaetes bacterium]|nr:MAG: hypothetical protein DRP58_08645 [Spirochaetota bacterium]